MDDSKVNVFVSNHTFIVVLMEHAPFAVLAGEAPSYCILVVCDLFSG